MRISLYKGTFYKVDVVKVDESIVFKCVLLYSYDLFCWDIIRTEFDSEEYTLNRVKSIQEEIINNLNNRFRLKK